MYVSFSGYVLGILMMAIIIVLGVGITFGYFYKRSVITASKMENSDSKKKSNTEIYNICYLLVKHQMSSVQ